MKVTRNRNIFSNPFKASLFPVCNHFISPRSNNIVVLEVFFICTSARVCFWNKNELNHINIKPQDQAK